MAEITPMMKQYLEIKEQNKDSILFFRLGDFYEMFNEDAQLASRELDLTLTTRDRGKAAEDQTPMCGIPYHSSDAYIARLIAKGYKGAICEQTEDPALAKGLVKRIISNDPLIDQNLFGQNGVEQAEIDEVLAEADIIINHMNLNETNYHYFDAEKFAKMKKKPIVINLGRGLCMDEPALIEALDSGQIRAFGADVLYDETPDLANHPLVGRDNVIITPHSAFYSSSSLRDLMIFPCNNIGHFLKGEKDQLFKLVNDVPVVNVL